MPAPEDPAITAARTRAGLCGICTETRVVRSGRGSVFLMCERGLRREPGYAKYPPLPVLRCLGWERVPAPDRPEND